MTVQSGMENSGPTVICGDTPIVNMERRETQKKAIMSGNFLFELKYHSLLNQEYFVLINGCLFCMMPA